MEWSWMIMHFSRQSILRDIWRNNGIHDKYSGITEETSSMMIYFSKTDINDKDLTTLFDPISWDCSYSNCLNMTAPFTSEGFYLSRSVFDSIITMLNIIIIIIIVVVVVVIIMILHHPSLDWFKVNQIAVDPPINSFNKQPLSGLKTFPTHPVIILHR